MYKPVLGNGLVTSEGDFWLRQRRLSQPAFLRSRLVGYAPLMVALTQKMLDAWHDGNRVDIHAEMSRLTSAIALKTLFGLDSSTERDAYIDTLREVFDLLSSRFATLLPIPRWLPTPLNVRLWRAWAGCADWSMASSVRAVPASEPGDDLLSRLICAQDDDGTRMTDRQLRDEAMTLYLAGHETTALTLSWTWYALAQQPARRGETGRRVVPASSAGRAPPWMTFPRLTYTEQVITESMRLYPPVYLIGREAVDHCTLGDYPVRRGTTVFLSQWVTHRDGRFYEDPLEFRPERWQVSQAKRLPKYAYFPFGGGPRVCIGNSFAMLEAVLLLATFGQHYRFTLEPEPPVAFQLGITLMPELGIPAVLKRR